MDRDDDGSEGRDLIRRNKVELCENTIVSTVLLDHLMQEDIISRIDAQDIRNETLPYNQASRLYDIIATRVKGIEATAKALGETRQSRAREILLKWINREPHMSEPFSCGSPLTNVDLRPQLGVSTTCKCPTRHETATDGTNNGDSSTGERKRKVSFLKKLVEFADRHKLKIGYGIGIVAYLLRFHPIGAGVLCGGYIVTVAGIQIGHWYTNKVTVLDAFIEVGKACLSLVLGFATGWLGHKILQLLPVNWSACAKKLAEFAAIIIEKLCTELFKLSQWLREKSKTSVTINATNTIISGAMVLSIQLVSTCVGNVITARHKYFQKSHPLFNADVLAASQLKLNYYNTVNS